MVDRAVGQIHPIEPLEDGIDHVRGPADAPVILEYGDYECPYSRQAYRQIQQIERTRPGGVRFAFRHFPLTGIHPRAAAAATAAEAAALQDSFWEMHDTLYHNQRALEEEDLPRYATAIGLSVARFERDMVSDAVSRRIERDVHSALASGMVVGTPTLFIGGVLHDGPYDADALMEALRG